MCECVLGVSEECLHVGQPIQPTDRSELLSDGLPIEQCRGLIIVQSEFVGAPLPHVTNTCVILRYLDTDHVLMLRVKRGLKGTNESECLMRATHD